MLFGKKQEQTEEKVPIQEVMELRKKGLPNEDMITYLKKKGYSIAQIRDAITQVDIKSTAEGMGSSVPLPSPPDVPDIEEELGRDQPEEKAEAPPQSTSFEEAKPVEIQEERNVPGTDMGKVERILEQMIEEKWSGVEKRYSELEKWKTDFISNISSIETKMEELTKRVENVDKMLLGKLDEYDKSMENVGVSIQSLEKVMKNMIPALSEKVKSTREKSEKKKK